MVRCIKMDESTTEDGGWEARKEKKRMKMEMKMVGGRKERKKRRPSHERPDGLMDSWDLRDQRT